MLDALSAHPRIKDTYPGPPGTRVKAKVVFWQAKEVPFEAQRVPVKKASTFVARKNRRRREWCS